MKTKNTITHHFDKMKRRGLFKHVVVEDTPGEWGLTFTCTWADDVDEDTKNNLIRYLLKEGMLVQPNITSPKAIP
jgi:hypothetical protein